ncbi:MAG TPA: GntR family transcriptional regulator [Streptosporangiaceae bacterium]
MTIDKGSKSPSADAARDAAHQDAAGSPIAFRLDPGSGVPTYLQLVHQVEQSLRLGYLKEGDRLPTVKETVEALAINPNTVLKAYRELDNKGLATGRPGQGTFIAGTLRRVGLTEQSELRKGLMSWLRTADDAGLDFEGIEALFAASMRDFRERRDVASARRGAARRADHGSKQTRGVA